MNVDMVHKKEKKKETKNEFGDGEREWRTALIYPETNMNGSLKSS